MHLLITDSGLGGLAVCAAAERALRGTPGLRITYFNAWPSEDGGYNDLPDIEARAVAFEPALAGMSALDPDQIVIACNTLSVVYLHTRFRRTTRIPVLGIVDAGIDLFRDALEADGDGSIVLFGTRTTIESGAHRDGLIARGVARDRIATVACHGLARAIESDPDGDEIAKHIDRCTAIAGDADPKGSRVYLGVCCTHYTYVREEMRSALERRVDREVRTLDPNDRLVAEIVRVTRTATAATGPTSGEARVTVVSKVIMDDRKRQSMAARLVTVSAATASALLAYTRVPDLF